MSDSEDPTGRGAGDTHSSKKKKQATAAASAQQQAALAAHHAAKARQRAQQVQAHAAAQLRMQSVAAHRVNTPVSTSAQPHDGEAGLGDDTQRQAEADPERLDNSADEDEHLAVSDTPLAMQALLVHLMQQQQKDKVLGSASHKSD